jgi:hypothetical protein
MMSMPSASGLLDLVLAGHLVDGGERGQHDFCALAARRCRRRRGRLAGDRRFPTVGRLGVSMCAEAARDRGDVDRGVAAADDHDALADVLQAAVVEGAQEGGGGDHVGALSALAGRARPPWAPRPRKTASNFLR